jgi:hypothetical protein
VVVNEVKGKGKGKWGGSRGVGTGKEDEGC